MMNFDSIKLRRFSIGGLTLFIYLCLCATVTFATTVEEQPACRSYDVRCPGSEELFDYDNDGYYCSNTYDLCCPSYIPFLCPVPWSYEKVDSLTATTDVPLTTDSTKPTPISLDTSHEMTAHASNINIFDFFDWYQYTVRYNYYNFATGISSGWGDYPTITAKTTNSPSLQWYLPNRNLPAPFNKPGKYTLYAKVRSNYVWNWDAVVSVSFFL